MTILSTGFGSRVLSMAAGETLLIRNFSGTETVTGSTVAREDVSARYGAGAYAYGPQTSATSVTLSSSGSLDYQVLVGDASPSEAVMENSGQLATDDAKRAVRGAVGSGQVGGVKASLIGDSRTQDYYIASRRTGGRSWIAWANAYMGCPMDVIAEYATSGQRSDQYFAEANFALMLADGAQIAIVGFPFANDLAQAVAGYTDTEGNYITLANLQAVAMARHQDRVRRLVEAGKTVVVCTEPGATNMNAAQVAIVYSINAAIRATYQGAYGVRLFDPVDLIWSRATTSTAITFKTGYSSDGVHGTTRWGNYVGRYAAEKFFPAFLTPRKSYGVDLATAVQLFPNTGYSTATGGLTANITGTDALPANTRLNGASAGLASYTATIATAADGTGNELTLTVTATGAVVVRFDHRDIPTAGLTYTDNFVGGVDCNVIAATNCRVYGDMQLFTNQGTEDGYALYSGDSIDIWTVDGSTGEIRLQSDPTQPPSGSSSGLTPIYRVMMDFKGAGSVTVKLKDPTVYKR